MDAVLETNLLEGLAVPASGHESRTIYKDRDLRVVLFVFAPGAVLADHAVPQPVTIQFLEGEARFEVEGEAYAAKAGSWYHLAPRVKHGVTAVTPVRMLLTMVLAPIA